MNKIQIYKHLEDKTFSEETALQAVFSSLVHTNDKVYMICTMWTDASHFHETLNTLEFALKFKRTVQAYRMVYQALSMKNTSKRG